MVLHEINSRLGVVVSCILSYSVVILSIKRSPSRIELTKIMAGKCVEIVFLAIAVAAGIGAGIAGGFTAHQLIAISEMEIPVISQPLQTFIQLRDPNLLTYTQASAALAISMAIVGIILAGTVLLRICKCNSGGTGTAILCVDLVLILLCVVGLGAGGVLGAIAASTWSTNYVATADSILVFFLPVFRETRDVLAATAATSLFASLTHIILMLVTLISCARSHNKETKI